MDNLSVVLLIFSLMLILSIFSSKISSKIGLPLILLFLVIGMLWGSDGPGGIYFDDPYLAQYISTVALIFILFSGGLDTEYRAIRPVLKEGILLSTLGVAITALITGIFASIIFKLPLKAGLLIGSIVSSTDAAAVFSVLRSKKISLKGNLKPLLELESGSNDPMAILLTMAFTMINTGGNMTGWGFFLFFTQQILLGLICGFILGKLSLRVINRLTLDYEGLYLVLIIAFTILIYSVTSVLGGNGYLAIYLSGVIFGNSNFIHKRSVLKFYEGLGWLMQIVLFLTLGLLVFPSRMPPFAFNGILLSLVLIFFSRPIAVFATLLFSKLSTKEKTLISWVGLRGSVPIVLGIIPLVSNVNNADTIFNTVFFVVLTSFIIQGTTIPFMAKKLNLQNSFKQDRKQEMSFEPKNHTENTIFEMIVPEKSFAHGKEILNLGIPDKLLIILITRDKEYIVPYGRTIIQSGDIITALGEKKDIDFLQGLIESKILDS